MYPNSMTIGETYDDYLRRNTREEVDLSDLLYDLNNNWSNYEWEQGEEIDRMPDEHEVTYIMTTEKYGIVFEGTGVYSCGELIKVRDIEIKR